eukprot:7608515-Alexandrium_andersonii.AAC.1
MEVVDVEPDTESDSPSSYVEKGTVASPRGYGYYGTEQHAKDRENYYGTEQHAKDRAATMAPSSSHVEPRPDAPYILSLIHISEPTRLALI